MNSIFITGAGSGMGLETAKYFSQRGWFVGAYDIDGDSLENLSGELPKDYCQIKRLDVANKDDYQSAINSFSDATSGRLDLLFNNAGIGKGGYFDEQSFEDILSIVNVNLLGVLHGIYLASKLLRNTENSLCFTTSSSSATYGMPGLAVYSATKHAVKGLTEALSIEMSRYGVRVADTLPGLIDTPLIPEGWRASAPSQGMFRLIPASEVAQVVWSAYHDTTGRLHWYIPEEIAELDKASANDPEGTRKKLSSLNGFE